MLYIFTFPEPESFFFLAQLFINASTLKSVLSELVYERTFALLYQSWNSLVYVIMSCFALIAFCNLTHACLEDAVVDLSFV